jgi:hypothetical protein
VLVHSGPILHDVLLVGAASFHSGHFSAQVKDLGRSAKGLLSSASFIRACVKQGVCHLHCGLAIYIKKYLKAKERIMETQIYFTTQKYNLQENPLKESKIHHNTL